MNTQIISIFLTSLAFCISQLSGNEEIKYPPGATDLVPNQRFEEFRPQLREKIEFTPKAIDLSQFEIIDEDEQPEGMNEWKINYDSTILQLSLENEKLKKEISELEQRVSKLEELLNQKT